MPAHAQVVVAAPHGDLLAASAALSRHRKRHRVTTHFTEDAVRVVLLLLLYLRVEELLVVEDGLARGLYKVVDNDKYLYTSYVAPRSNHYPGALYNGYKKYINNIKFTYSKY